MRHLLAPRPLARLGLTLLLLPPIAGCYRRVSYRSPQGRQVEMVNWGFDTRIGKLAAQTESGTLQIEDVDTQTRVAATLVEVAGAIAADRLSRAQPRGGAR